jgi:hypothetical protein
MTFYYPRRGLSCGGRSKSEALSLVGLGGSVLVQFDDISTKDCRALAAVALIMVLFASNLRCFLEFDSVLVQLIGHSHGPGCTSNRGIRLTPMVSKKDMMQRPCTKIIYNWFQSTTYTNLIFGDRSSPLQYTYVVILTLMEISIRVCSSTLVGVERCYDGYCTCALALN